MPNNIPANQIHQVLKKYILADGMSIVFDAEQSHDDYFVDAISQKPYLDLFSFFATQPIAYNHPSITTPEFRSLLADAAIHRPSLSDVYTVEYAQAVSDVCEQFFVKHFNHLFFIEGGALGVENALKAAFDWKVRKNIAAGRAEKGYQVIHFEHAFHGRSGYTLSLTNTFDPKKHMYFPKFSWPRVASPCLSFPITADVVKDVAAQEQAVFDRIRQLCESQPHDIAALIIEPIQCEGGDRHFRPEFFQGLRHLADTYEFLLIFDEVQTGIGITGKNWCFEHFGMVPDLIAFGKKTQIAGCASTKRIDEVKDNVFTLASRINSTWGGNLVDFLRFQKHSEVIAKEKLLLHAQHIGSLLLQELQTWAKHKPGISNIRGCGLMIAFDLPTTDMRDKLHKKIFSQGALVLSCGPRSLRLRPHLDFQKEHIHTAIDIFDKAEKNL